MAGNLLPPSRNETEQKFVCPEKGFWVFERNA